jgi:sterol 3beta-glucosyltransferase
MKIGIVIFGSRGDIQPYAALAHGLAAAGHEVAISANGDAEPVVAASGVKFVPMDLDVREFLRSPVGQEALALGTAPALLDGGNIWLDRSRPTIVEGASAVADGADLVISGFPMDDYAAAVCEANGVPLMLGYLTPWLPTTEFPPAYMRVGLEAPERLTGEDNLRIYREFEEIFWRHRHAGLNELRASMGLAPQPRPLLQAANELDITVLHAYSSTVVPRPANWGPRSVYTGFWRLAAQSRQLLGEAVPPEPLVQWLGAGPAPIFLGFGSMPILDPAPVLEMAVEAARRAGVRILIGAGWTEMAEAADGLPEDVAVVNEVDHDWLFPLCRGVLHHGGAGTTAAALYAGRPSYVFSMFFDQAFWGGQIEQLGAGGHRRFTGLDLDTLTEALVLMGREDVREHAAAAGKRLRQEDGVAHAIRLITDPAHATVPRF